MKELYGKVLVFTISHNNRIANLYGHYADAGDRSNEEPEFYRFDIDISSLVMYDGRDRYKSYNFVRNLYEKFAPEHLRRIKDAVAHLPDVKKRTGLSFAASELAPKESGSHQSSHEGSQESGFRIPGEPASVAKVREQMEQEMEQQSKASKEREEEMERQLTQQLEQEMEQQREQEMEQQKKALEQEMEQQKKALEQQLEQQREQMMEQREQMEQVMALLRQSRT